MINYIFKIFLTPFPPTTSAATRSSTTTTNSADIFVKSSGLSVEKNGRIRPYIDFSHFHKEWQLHRENMHNGKKCLLL